MKILFLLCRFCVGDRYYLCENRILCEYDYEDRMLMVNLQQRQTQPQTQTASTSSFLHSDAHAFANGSAATSYDALSRMKQQTDTLSEGSSGYNSPSPGALAIAH